MCIHRLFPSSSSFSNGVIHTVFHCHDFFHWNTLKDWHPHLILDPEERIHAKHEERYTGQYPNCISFRRIGRNIQNHIDRSDNSNQRKQRTTRNLKGTWCFRQPLSQNQNINMCQNIRNHPENRTNQDQEGNGIGRIVTQCGKNENENTDKNHTNVRNATLISLCKNLSSLR